MKNMQRQVPKILLLIMGLCGFLMASGQVTSFRLGQADSLFEKKQYTQSLEHYQAILERGEFTPSMLLKMAYIEEGLGRIGQALYYLDRYYLVSNDKSALDKMEELSTKYNLQGYENSDATLILSLYHDYRDYISTVLAAAAVFFLSLLFYWRQRRKRAVTAASALFILMVLLAVHINFGERISTGIISGPNTYLMEGPSAGAPVMSVINEGHRVEVVGKVDVWYKVKWRDNTVFVRDHDLLVSYEL
jgi:tetratricopeptide (TPR) repeat protein